jgi:hypothetical protein
MKKKLFTFFSLFLLFGLHAAGEQGRENRISTKANTEEMVTITCSSSEGGEAYIRYDMVLLPNNSQIEKGGTIAVLVRAYDGFILQSVTINGEDKTQFFSSPYGYNYVANEDVNIHVVFAPIVYEFTYAFDNTKGNVVVNSNETNVISGTQIKRGTELTVTVTPNSNYKIDSIRVNNVERITNLLPDGGNTFNLTIIEATALEVIFTLNTSISTLSENKPFIYIQKGKMVIEGAPAGSNVQLYNLAGQLIRNISILSNKEIITGNNLCEPFYIVRFNYKDNVSIYKVINK